MNEYQHGDEAAGAPPPGCAHETAQWMLTAWHVSGRRIVETPVGRRTLALSRRHDGDVHVPELGEHAVFLRMGEDQGTLFIIPSEDARTTRAKEQRLTLLPGRATACGELTWLLTKAASGIKPGPSPLTTNDQTESHSAAPQAQLLGQLMSWVVKPMSNLAELRLGLKSFMQLLFAHTPAISGMLALAEGDGFALAAAEGLSLKEAQKLWERMPPSLTEEVMRSRAKVLLPEDLRRNVSGDSTVFIRGVRSVAGFPVLAEGRLVAIFYLGFDNLLRRLSSELQHGLEAAADLLGLVIQRAELREQLEKVRLQAAAAPEARLPAGRLMVGSSPKLVAVYNLISRLAPVDVPVLILGETGTGKELAAKELHRLSPRGRGPFIVVNAAALPETLIESELFGHRRGAFTGALTDRVGLVEQADSGTLFIDEIGELQVTMQVKLLRVLQDHAFTRIGETVARASNFRLITATHRDLSAMVASGSFREDLYYRIAGALLKLPPLRERREDILLLANFFRGRFAERHGLPDKEWSAEAAVLLTEQPWPGNVRELENAVARAFVMADGAFLRARDLGLTTYVTEPEAKSPEAMGEATLEVARDAWMKSFLGRALERHKGHRSETAKALGIGERTLFRYIEQLEIGEK